MSAKNISNSTLSLRFMQNAQRAKLQAQVEAEQSKIKDDAEWSVSQEVREAWGIGSSSASTSEVQSKAQFVTHEASYMPFIFGEDEDEVREEGEEEGTAAGPLRPVRGRRTFNDRGEEVLGNEEPDNERHELIEEAKAFSNALKNKGRPTSISGFKAPLPTKSKDGKTFRAKTAQQLIRESPATAPASLSSAPPFAATAVKTGTTGFMKPAGVDAPQLPSNRKSSAKKRHRDRDAASDATDSTGKKRKKKATEAGLATVE
ncbi:hypothetical protein FOMPIDRAFT_1017422 [Fomitopsis schrenkii]|uniref:Uncharacterized protein n=1 Tax=Fomitopsis schrenkii TaxID=2126942 RepID=S8E295_FOMSC|nr:hypothetical protein FOMPIDRAFT_1017422 [Fomitopsis schrenkii]